MKFNQTNLDNLTVQTLDFSIDLALSSLKDWTSSPEAINQLEIPFGKLFDKQIAQDLLGQWQENKFDSLPPIQILSSTELSGARGAYSIQTNTIYLSQEFLEKNSKN